MLVVITWSEVMRVIMVTLAMLITGRFFRLPTKVDVAKSAVKRRCVCVER